MAHKIRVPLYRRLRDLLEATGKTYSVFVSTALHENTSFDDSFVVRFEELQSIFNGRVYFMGYLSDTAVFNHLVDCTFLAAFFEKGLRANNTTVNAAMEVGCAVITNLDEHSPKGLVHMKNVIDINRCDRLPEARGSGDDRPCRAGDRTRGLRVGSAGRAAAACRAGIGGYTAPFRARQTRGERIGRDIQDRHARDRRPREVLRDRRDRAQPPGQRREGARAVSRGEAGGRARGQAAEARQPRPLHARGVQQAVRQREQLRLDLRRASRVPRVRPQRVPRAAGVRARSSASTSSRPPSTSPAPISCGSSTSRRTRSPPAI